ncbi:threonine--tRNA ligase, partial [Dubosiella newyorkensis]
EVKNVLSLIDKMYGVFGLEYSIELSTRPESGYIGTEEIWDASEKALANACVHAGKEYVVNPGDGAFYGPKLDIHIKDSLGRDWQCGTIQLDMNLPERFHCTYVDSDGSRKTPLMLHRVVYGSIERFIGILIEHFGGHFPLWLAPQQIVIIPVHHEKHVDYANQVKDNLEKAGLRVKVDDRNEKLGYRVREAQIKKIPYQIVVGDRDQEEGTVTIRQSGKKESVTMPLEEAIERFRNEVETKCLFGKEAE